MIEHWKSALSGLKSILACLDAAEAPPEVGAHLDLAIFRLSEAIMGAEKKRDPLIGLSREFDERSA